MEQTNPRSRGNPKVLFFSSLAGSGSKWSLRQLPAEPVFWQEVPNAALTWVAHISWTYVRELL